jgi:hypothetical protein
VLHANASVFKHVPHDGGGMKYHSLTCIAAIWFHPNGLERSQLGIYFANRFTRIHTAVALADIQLPCFGSHTMVHYVCCQLTHLHHQSVYHLLAQHRHITTVQKEKSKERPSAVGAATISSERE